MWGINKTFLSVGRHFEYDAPTVWNVIADTWQWTRWGPTVAGVVCEDRFIKATSRGKVRTSLGLWFPFRITEYRNGVEWRWNVASVSATGHRIVVHPDSGCDLWFDTPILAAPYSLICSMALLKIERLLPVALLSR
jgi:hypothetical protein